MPLFEEVVLYDAGRPPFDELLFGAPDRPINFDLLIGDAIDLRPESVELNLEHPVAMVERLRSLDRID